jgi:hypothetical protein
MPAETIYFPFSEIVDINSWPLASLIPDGLEKLWLTGPAYDQITQTGYIAVQIDGEIALRVPGLDFATFALGSTAGSVDFELTASFEPFRLGIEVPVTLRLDANILRPIKGGTGYEPDLDAETLNIGLGTIGLSIDGDGNLDLGLSAAVQIPRCMIGTTGVVIEGKIRWLTPVTPNLPPGTPANFTGLYFDDVIVEMPQLPPAVDGIRMDDVFLGTGGFSGIISKPGLTLQWNGTDFTGPMTGELFGFKGGISALSVRFEQNALVASEIRGDIFVPYFNKRVGLTLGLDGTGGLTATAALPHSSPPETGVTPGGAGYLVHLNVANVLSLDIAALRFEALSGSLPRLGISGRVAPGSGVLDFPPIEFSGLWIDTRGRIHTEGDGLRLPSRYVLNFHGFQLEISKLGFGNTEDRGKWIGFTGGVRLTAGMPAGASVEGLRITWFEDGRQPQITLNGVRVDFEVPNTLKFNGAVSYDSATQQFRGAVKLDLIALRMQVDAVAVFGRHQGQNYLAVYLAAQFPAGIPLFATGLGVYGMAGLFALNMEPNRQASQPWYEIGSTTDWYHSPPAVGVTRLEKWKPQIGSMAFGAGVTLGTLADNGHTFSGQLLLAIVFPGPILLLQGSASLLKERATLDTDATFRAIAVLDGRAGTLSFGLDAQYRFDNTGKLIDIRGAAEGFFNFNDPNAWRLNVGLKDPRERRLSARLFQLFDAYAYVSLNAQQLAMGAWIGFRQQWQFGPLSVALEAWLDGNARVSWKPAHFYGDLWLHGSARLSVFGFSVGLTVDARLTADVFDPFHIVGQFSVAIDLPWPFSDISVNINLEWGPNPVPPPLPLALKEVAIEHFKATTSWPLPRSGSAPLLLPNYDSNGDGFWQTPIYGTVPGNLANSPVVPLDARPHITFARNVHDDARVGVNAQAVVPAEERVGDPVTKRGPALIRYGLHELALEKLSGSQWTAVARKGTTPNPAGVDPLYGSWAPMPQMPGGDGRNPGQVKLWLWSKTPFNYTRRSSRAWDDWFAVEFSGYPCQTLPGTCWDFEDIDPIKVGTSWSHPDEPGLVITSQNASNLSIADRARPAHGLTRAFRIQNLRSTIQLPRPTNLVRLMVPDGLLNVHNFRGENAGGQGFQTFLKGSRDNLYIEIAGVDIVRIHFIQEVSVRSLLAQGLSGAIGCDYVPSRHQLLFVEFHGKLSMIELITGQYVVLGTGYANPEDVAVSASGTFAYVTERSGTLLRIDLTSSNLNRSAATVISSGLNRPQQIALDETRGKAYVVEFNGEGGEGRLLCIEIDGPTPGRQAVVASGLEQAIGIVITPDATTAYVNEQGAEAGRISRISLDSGARETVINNIPNIFFLHWANAAHDSILTVARDPENLLVSINLRDSSVTIFKGTFPFRPSSVAILPDDRLVVCSDQVLTIIPTAQHILKICDVGSDVLVRHFEDELARWSQTGEVLEPYTQYRLRVVTKIRARGEGELRNYSEEKTVEEFAYFRTDGPPGVARLSPPIGSQAAPTFTTPLDDLSRYVQRTIPVSIEQGAGTPLFYRSHPIGIEFNENYVDLMYRLGRRDLTIQLYDGNGAIRGDNGARLVIANQWGRAEEITLTEQDQRWIGVLEASGCALVDVGSVVKNTTFNQPGQRHLLPPSTLCEARLVPALLHEAFAGYGTNPVATGPNGRLQRWQVQDDPGSPASRWEIRVEDSDFVLVQTTTASTTLTYANSADPNAADQPSTWTEHGLKVHLRSNDGRIGVVWRYQNQGQHYRFVLDRAAGKRELIRIAGGVQTVLATGNFTYTPNQTYEINVEAVKENMRVYQDGALVFAVSDSTIATGSVGVYCAGNTSARFTDVFVDDFRASAPVVYRFSFLTSRFENFADHLGSFENKISRVAIPAAVNVAPFIAAAVPWSTPASDAESRAYDGLLTQIPAGSPSPVVRVMRVEQNGNVIAFLIQSPEPFDWPLLNLQPVPQRVLRKSDGSGLMIVMPGPTEYKITYLHEQATLNLSTGFI